MAGPATKKTARPGWALPAAVAALLLTLAVPATSLAASPPVFFGGWYGDAIGRVGVDGSGLDPTLIQGEGLVPTAMTVSGEYLYWQSNSLPVRIGRSRLDGTDVQPALIESKFGEVGDGGLTVSDDKLYWEESVRTAGGSFKTIIDRASLDGSHIEDEVATLGSSTGGPFAVSGNFAYFVSASTSSPWNNIARVRIDGPGRTPRFVSHRQINGSTLLLKGRYLYWIEQGRHTYLARASADGAQLNTRFRQVPDRGCHTHSEITDAAIGSRYLFLACDSGRIDRLALQGRPRMRELVTHARLGGGGMVLAVASP